MLLSLPPEMKVAKEPEASYHQTDAALILSLTNNSSPTVMPKHLSVYRNSLLPGIVEDSHLLLAAFKGNRF